MRSFVLIAGLACALAVAAAEPDSARTAAQLQATLERLNALDQWFSEAEEQRAIWLVELQRQDRGIAKVNQQVGDVVAEIAALNSQLRDLRNRINELDALKSEQAQRIAKHIGAAYRLTGQDFLKQLLNQESPDTLDRMWRYHRYFSESRLEVLAEYRQTLTDLADTNAAIDKRLGEQTRQRSKLEAEQQRLGQQRGERAKLIAKLDDETETNNEEYARLQQDRTRLEQLLAELRRRSTELDGSAFVRAKGGLPMPVQGNIRHAFGSARADNRLRWHGIDIRAEHGAPVTAVFRGRVIFADWLRGFGFLAVVDHGSDYMTLYGHVDILHKKVGDWVESGELIAGAGNSGGIRESGVYFEVRHKGNAKDPISWISR